MLATAQDFLTRSPGVTEAPEGIDEQLRLAQQRVESYLRRQGKLELAERTETVHVGSGGVAYPEAYPIVSTASGTLRDTRSISMPSLTGANVSVTYMAGYDTETVPVEIIDAIVATAAAAIEPDEVPEGATNVRAGDLSVSFGEGGFSGSSTGLPSGVASSIRQHRRKG